MFKLVSIALFVVSLHLTLARPQAPAAVKPAVPIVSQTQTLDGTGTFQYAYETGDGIKEEASGSLKTLKVPKVDPATGQVVGEEEGQGIVQTGKYSYTGDDGVLYEVTYIADENGFQPSGAHLPVAPPAQ